MRYSELIAAFGAGTLDAEASDALVGVLAEVQRRVALHGTATGEVTLKLVLEGHQGGRVDMHADVTMKRPGPPRQKDVRWLDAQGTLVGANPQQEPLRYTVTAKVSS
jgi:hypothetical protein